MIILKRLADLPRDIKFKSKTSNKPCEDADYVFFHKSLNFYSCYFNIGVIKYKTWKEAEDEVMEEYEEVWKELAKR